MKLLSYIAAIAFCIAGLSLPFALEKRDPWSDVTTAQADPLHSLFLESKNEQSPAQKGDFKSKRDRENQEPQTTTPRETAHPGNRANAPQHTSFLNIGQSSLASSQGR